MPYEILYEEAHWRTGPTVTCRETATEAWAFVHRFNRKVEIIDPSGKQITWMELWDRALTEEAR